MSCECNRGCNSGFNSEWIWIIIAIIVILCLCGDNGFGGLFGGGHCDHEIC